jgi:hypothetical protein
MNSLGTKFAATEVIVVALPRTFTGELADCVINHDGTEYKQFGRFVKPSTENPYNPYNRRCYFSAVMNSAT